MLGQYSILNFLLSSRQVLQVRLSIEKIRLDREIEGESASAQVKEYHYEGRWLPYNKV